MTCVLCQEWLQQRLDGDTVASSPELSRHLAECTECAALQSAALRLSAGLRLLTPAAPSAAFTNELVAAILAEQRATHRQRRIRHTVLALAACLLVGTAALGLYYSGWWKAEATPQPVPRFVEKHTPEPETAPLPTASVRETVADAGQALAALTSRTADETVGQTRWLMPKMTGPSLDELDLPPTLEPTKSYLEAGQGVTLALDPVTQSAKRAVALFRRDLAHVEPSMNPH